MTGHKHTREVHSILMALVLTLSTFTSLAAMTAVAAETTTQTAAASTAAATVAAKATPKIATAATTTTTMGASNPNPKVGETITITVILHSRSTALARSVNVWHTTSDGKRWEDGTHTTTNGAYSFTQAYTSAGQRVYHAEFAGDSTYGASSDTITVNVQPYKPPPWQPIP